MILLAGAIGIGFVLRSIFRDLEGEKHNASASELSTAPSVQTASEAIGDPAINALMVKYNLDLKSATYLAGGPSRGAHSNQTPA